MMTTKELIRLVENERGSAFQNCNDCEYGTHNGEVIEKLNHLAELEDKIEQGTLKELPKNVVVLTREEQQKYAAYKIIEPQIRGCLDRERELEKRLETIRNETAEKFAERLKEELENRSAIDGYDLEDLKFEGEIIQECIDGILKEITEGRDEFQSRDN